MTANCSVVPASTPSNAGIAGAGVLLSFIITATVALCISAGLVVQDTWGRAAQQRKASNDAGISTSSVPTPTAAIIGRKLLNSYSDQQIVTGIGIQSLGLAQIDTLVPYHFFLIWMLGLLSTAVHNAALLALVHDFRRDWVLRWLRQTLMFTNLALSCIYGVFVLRELADGLPQTLPIACALQSGVQKNSTSTGDSTAAWSGSAGAFQFIATVAVVAGNCIVFLLATWYLHSRAQRFYRIVQTVGLALMAAVAIGAAVRVVLLSQAFGHPSVALSDNGETSWSFGQLLSLLMLLLPLISVVEIARGEIRVAPPVQDDGSSKGGGFGDTVPLVEHQLPMRSAGRASFQPTPFFSSRRSNRP